ncbi:MAG: LacI family DNA-binding transcriptional regulator [Pseudomonadota bacterium]
MIRDQNSVPPARIPTLADVARHAGVSTATVSRSLNTPEQVGRETRARVLSAVQDLGYAPNFNARALAAKRSNTVGVVIPTMENAIFARGIQAFQEELGLHGLTLLIASSSYRQDLESRQIHTLVARGADALLLIGYQRAPEVYEFLNQRGVPTLVAWAFDRQQTHPAIGFDNVQAMTALARAVIGHGHRRLAMISAHMRDNDRARDRVAGVRAAMQEAGLPTAELTLIETHYGFDSGAAALREIMAKAPDTTAVLCGNDVLAVGALQGAREMGLDVPGQLSVTGFDDIDLATIAEPSLTTVHVPHREMGRRAAQMLVAILNGEAKARTHELQTSLSLRQSLARRPTGAT